MVEQRPAGIQGPGLGEGEEPGAYVMTQEEMAEHSERVLRNEVRAQRRTNNEDDVSDDEDVAPPFDEPRRTPPRNSPAPPPGGAHTGGTGTNASGQSTADQSAVKAGLVSMLETLLSPNTFTRVSAAMTTGSSTASAPLAGSDPGQGATAATRSSGKERASRIAVAKETNLFARKAKAPEALVTLLSTRHHLPLTMCTNSALRTIRSGTGLKYNKVYNTSEEKHNLIDVGQWPVESSMSLEDWRQAWPNFLVILDAAAESETTSLFKAHYDALCEKEEIEHSFEIILEFDIEIRQAFFAGSHEDFAVKGAEWENRFQTLSMGVMRRRMEAFNRPRDVAHPYSRPDRPPYPRHVSDRKPFPNHERHDHSSSKPFRGGRQSSTDMLCLKCGQGAPKGHHASACRNDKLPNGKPTFCSYQAGRLIVATSGKEICLFWNLSGDDSCRGGSKCGRRAAHICSFCGATDHHATDKHCLGFRA